MNNKQDLLNRLERAYYSGVLKVREGDQWVEYQNSEQMRVAIADLRREIAGPRGQRRRVITSNGY